jgi:3-oxoacyl-[acyl-carrier protein] reductase
MMRLKDKVAIVTGAGSGFGEGMTKLFAQEGASVAVADIRKDAAERVASEIVAGGGNAFAVGVDVTSGAQMEAMVKITLERYGKLDIMVNNAGTTHKSQPMLEVDEATFDRIYAVNVKSIFHSAKSVVPVFEKTGKGVFLNISSTAAVRPRPGLAWYNGSKGAVDLLTKSMAVELASKNIRVCALNPAMGVTALLAEFLPGGIDTPETRARIISSIPLGRFSQPEDIAHAALFLVSDEAAFITGVCLEVDGGRCI